MSLSRLDLPRIIEAIKELHRIIAVPPAENWQAPLWLVEQYKQTTLGEAGVPKTPTHGGLIRLAADEVLNRLMPPWHHRKEDCPEIAESLLDMRHKVKLIELRELLASFAFGQTLADNRAEALRVLAFLESVVEELTGELPEAEKTKPPPLADIALDDAAALEELPETSPITSAVMLLGRLTKIAPGAPDQTTSFRSAAAAFREKIHAKRADLQCPGYLDRDSREYFYFRDDYEEVRDLWPLWRAWLWPYAPPPEPVAKYAPGEEALEAADRALDALLFRLEELFGPPTDTKPGADGVPFGAPLRQTLSTEQPHADGPEGGCWVWWQNRRHDVPKGNVYKFLAFMWDRDSASYESLIGPVFDDDVAPQTMRSLANKTGKVLKGIGIPWRFSTDSVTRNISRRPAY